MILRRWPDAGLALTLFVARIFANDADDVLPFHNAARLTQALDGCSHFHNWILVLEIRGQKTDPLLRGQ
jgi:hypothetical protein